MTEQTNGAQEKEASEQPMEQNVAWANSRNAKKVPLLCQAIWWDNYDLVAEALRHGADTEAKHPNGNTALFVALYGKFLYDKNPNRWKIARLLVENGADIFTTNERGWQPIITAVKGRDNALLRAMLSSPDTNVNHVYIEDMPLPAYAVNQHNVELTQTLLEFGADVRSFLPNGATLLHSPELTPKIASLLIGAGADVSAKTARGQTPLHHVALSYFPHDLSDLLITAGADVNARDHAQATPLMYMCYYGYTSVARLLLERGAEIDACDLDGNTALHRAVAINREETARFLVEAGADPDKPNHAGVTPVIASVTAPHAEELARYMFSVSKEFSEGNSNENLTRQDFAQIVKRKYPTNPEDPALPYGYLMFKTYPQMQGRDIKMPRW